MNTIEKHDETGFHTVKPIPDVRLLPTEYRVMAQSFRRSLLAHNKSERTVTTYLEAVRLFGDFLTDRGMPTDVSAITRKNVESITDAWPETASEKVSR